MHQTQAETACIQTHILYDVVGRILFCSSSFFILWSGLQKNPLASMSQLTGCVGSLWDGWKLWGHSLREPHAAQEGLFHFASPAGSNKTAPRRSFITRSNVDASLWPLIPSGKKNPILPITRRLRYCKKALENILMALKKNVWAGRSSFQISLKSAFVSH